MPIARKNQVDLESTPFYHCIARCVRRAFLCGNDPVSGENYDHRKQWIVDRIKFLTTVFAVEIAAYAVLSNHFHIIVYIDQKRALKWSDEEVLRRWNRLFGKPNQPDMDQYYRNKDTVFDVAELRKRLYSLSWLMRCMNETIAREANREDRCKGRFWEGRFKSQALLDEGALLACCAYVDLNPIRAGIALTPEDSDYTSIQERIHQYWASKQKHQKRVETYASAASEPLGTGLLDFLTHDELDQDRIPMLRKDYFELVDWTGRAIREDKSGAIPEHLKPILARLDLDERQWVDSVKYFRRRFFHMIGPVSRLNELAQSLSKRWLRGKTGARSMYRQPAS